MTATALLSQAVQLALALALAPLLVGWVNQCRAWLSNRSAPPLLTPYRTIRKLFMKDAVVASNASPLFRLTPYVVFGAMCCAGASRSMSDVRRNTAQPCAVAMSAARKARCWKASSNGRRSQHPCSARLRVQEVDWRHSRHGIRGFV